MATESFGKIDLQVTESITYKSGETKTIIENQEIVIVSDIPQKIKVEYDVTVEQGKSIDFGPNQTITFNEPGKKVNMVSNEEIKLDVKKPSPPVKKGDESLETVIEDPTTPKKQAAGSIESYKKGTSMTFEGPAVITYPQGAILINEKMETVIIEPGQSVEYSAGDTFI
jgi:hypothetical protein